MPPTFAPRLDVLTASQRLLWPDLDAVPSDFVLYGGTGLTLQLGHRVSEDFDFFSSVAFDPSRLQARLPFFRDLNAEDTNVWVHRKADNLEAFVDRQGPVKVAFFGGLDTLYRIQDPRLAGWLTRAGGIIARLGRHENAINTDAWELEGLCGHSCAGVPWNRPVNGFGRGQGD
jgi:hypothetical protein